MSPVKRTERDTLSDQKRPNQKLALPLLSYHDHTRRFSQTPCSCPTQVSSSAVGRLLSALGCASNEKCLAVQQTSLLRPITRVPAHPPISPANTMSNCPSTQHTERRLPRALKWSVRTRLTIWDTSSKKKLIVPVVMPGKTLDKVAVAPDSSSNTDMSTEARYQAEKF